VKQSGKRCIRKLADCIAFMLDIWPGLNKCCTELGEMLEKYHCSLLLHLLICFRFPEIGGLYVASAIYIYY
jgi:hypothetical protein